MRQAHKKETQRQKQLCFRMVTCLIILSLVIVPLTVQLIKRLGPKCMCTTRFSSHCASPRSLT